MKKPRTESPRDGFVEDVESLLKQSVVEEASAKVWDKFSAALEKLDPTSQELIKDFFAGRGLESIRKRHGISRAEAEAWLAKARRELVANLRNGFQARQ